MADNVKQNKSNHLAALEARFGPAAESWYLGIAGDFVIGTVRNVGAMTTSFGPAHYVDFFAVEGLGHEVDGNGNIGASMVAEPKKLYRLVFLGEVMKGQFSEERFQPKTVFLALHRGMRSNKAKTQEYKDIELIAPYEA